MIEFDCEGCGVHVYAFGRNAPPRHMFCDICEFLNEAAIKPDEFWRLYQLYAQDTKATD